MVAATDFEIYSDSKDAGISWENIVEILACVVATSTWRRTWHDLSTSGTWVRLIWLLEVETWQ